MSLPVFNIKKCLWMQLTWRCGSHIRDTKPKLPSTHNVQFKPTGLAFYHPDYIGETLLERAKRLEILDTWTPHLQVVFSSTRHLVFTGKRALSIYKTWSAMQFGKKK